LPKEAAEAASSDQKINEYCLALLSPAPSHVLASWSVAKVFCPERLQSWDVSPLVDQLPEKYRLDFRCLNRVFSMLS
jgi:hypothetical protein